MSVYEKLFLLQQKNLNLYKDKEAHNYSYVSLVKMWDTVQPHLQELSLYIDWYSSVCHDTGKTILHCDIVDIEDGSRKSSKMFMDDASVSIRATGVNKSGVETVTDKYDFKVRGAEASYWYRKMAITALGLITREDEEAEEMDLEGSISSTKGRPSARRPSNVELFS